MISLITLMYTDTDQSPIHIKVTKFVSQFKFRI
jgi:hypothetical protein